MHRQTRVDNGTSDAYDTASARMLTRGFAAATRLPASFRRPDRTKSLALSHVAQIALLIDE
jgi:hypothetical protein